MPGGSSHSQQELDRLDGSITGGVGTAFYSAPEQEGKGSSSYDMNADIFSLGVIIFEMFHSSFFDVDGESRGSRATKRG